MIIQLVLKSNKFIEELGSEINRHVIGKQISYPDVFDGASQAEVSSNEFSGLPSFEEPEGSDMKWSLNFKWPLSVSATYIRSDGANIDPDFSDSECEGLVSLTFPPNSLNEDNLDDIISGIDIEIDDIKVHTRQSFA